MLKEKVRLFVRLNDALLHSGLCTVGSWLDETENRIYLDISILLDDKSRAIKVGEEYNQIAIFDLQKMEVVMLSGDGNIPPDKELLSEMERISSIVED